MEQTITMSLGVTLGVQLVTAGFFAGSMSYMAWAQAKTMNRLEEWLKNHEVRLQSHDHRLTVTESMARNKSA